ncbi:toxin HicA [Bilophila wadsworthia]|uniref:toxin HicA n=1 Tax=Bilophila wadsworthia TaxID=35833 RepID=UPI00242F5684|nr:toxin HicA [Bilophila wadsworthia]MCI6541950.1 toxin HicA [Bilophila wadsworthia]
MNIKKILDKMRQSPKNIRYSELVAVCQEFFGEPRQQGTSHCIFKTPWQGDPRVNIQDKNGMAKPYQVKQVLTALAKLNGGE